MGIDGILIAQHRQRTLRPGTVEDGLLQHQQILTGHLILSVDEISLCESLHHTGALVIVRNGLHRLEGHSLRRVHQSEVEIYLARQLGGGEVALKPGQEPLGAALIEVEGALAQLVGHAQSQIRGTHAHRQVGRPPLSLGDNGIPVLRTHQVVILYQLIFLLVEAHVSEDSQQPHSQGHFYGIHHSTGLRKQPHNITDDPNDCWKYHQQIGQGSRNTIVADTQHHPLHRERQVMSAQQHQCQRIDNRYRHQYDSEQQDHRSRQPVGQRHHHEHDEKTPQQHSTLIAPCEENLCEDAGHQHVQGQCHRVGQHHVLVAHRIPQHHHRDKTQGIMTLRAHQPPGEPLHQHEQQGDDSRSSSHAVIELHQEFRNVTCKAARLSHPLPEVIAVEEEELQLLLVRQHGGIAESPEQKHRKGEGQRQPGLPVFTQKSLHWYQRPLLRPCHRGTFAYKSAGKAL